MGREIQGTRHRFGVANRSQFMVGNVVVQMINSRPLINNGAMQVWKLMKCGHNNLLYIQYMLLKSELI